MATLTQDGQTETLSIAQAQRRVASIELQGHEVILVRTGDKEDYHVFWNN